jgi:hypothetical protein
LWQCARHFSTAHIAELLSEIPDALVAEPDVKFHTIVTTKTLGDVVEAEPPVRDSVSC